MTNPTEVPMVNAIDDVKATHRHNTRGSEYVLIGIGKMQADSWLEFRPSLANAPLAQVSVNMREVAIYRSATDPTEIWVRPREEFEDGRFEVLPLSPAPSQHTGWSDKAVEAFDRALEAAPSMDPYDGRRQLLIAGVKLRAALSAASSIAPATGFEVKHADDCTWNKTRITLARRCSCGVLNADPISPSGKESGEPS